MSSSRGRVEVVTDVNLSFMTDTHATDHDGHADPYQALGFDPRGTLIERLGIEIDTIGADRVTARMPVSGNLQPAGLLHGGASVAFAETLGSIAAQIHAGTDGAAVGIEINATHHRSVREGWVHGTTIALHRGRTTASYETTITDDTGKLVCTSRLTCVILRAESRP